MFKINVSKTNISKISSLSFGILVLGFLIGFYALAAWQEPTASPPGGNVSIPLTTGDGPQERLYTNLANG